MNLKTKMNRQKHAKIASMLDKYMDELTNKETDFNVFIQYPKLNNNDIDFSSKSRTNSENMILTYIYE